MSVDIRGPEHNPSRVLDDGFSLIELLVVIAVIGILAALLFPALARSRRSSQRTLCLNNIRQQYLCQIFYADDNADRFPTHNDNTPSHQRSPGTVGESLVDRLKPHYLNNFLITICPITALHYGKIWPMWRDPFSIVNGTYGGWGTKADYVSSAYMWLANYPGMRFLSPDGTSRPDAPDAEPAWPTTLNDCDSTRAFITHRIALDTTSNGFAETGHSGFMAPKSWKESRTREQPVGSADGSAKVRPRAEIRARATGGMSNEAYFY